MNWVFTKDRLPPVDETVIFLLAKKKYSSVYYEGDGHGRYSFRETGSGYPLSRREIIAWMPMPAAPSASPERGQGLS